MFRREFKMRGTSDGVAVIAKRERPYPIACKYAFYMAKGQTITEVFAVRRARSDRNRRIAVGISQRAQPTHGVKRACCRMLLYQPGPPRVLQRVDEIHHKLVCSPALIVLILLSEMLVS